MLLKRVLLIVLALALVGVWLRNLFLLVPEGVARRRTFEAPKVSHWTAASTEEAGDDDFVYIAGARDPFEVPQRKQLRETRVAGPTPAAAPVRSIRASWLGHVWTAKNPYVVVFDSLTHRTSLLCPGDTLNGFILKRITQHEIQWKAPRGPGLVWTIEK